MKNSIKRIPFLIPFILLNLTLCHAQAKSPIDVVKIFDKCYGGPLMDEIADLTTPKFRDNKPKSVWVVDTWKTLRKIKYERLNSSIIDSKIEDDKAIVVLEAKIKTAGGEVAQKEIYYLVKQEDAWLIDDLIVTEEEIDLENMNL